MNYRGRVSNPESHGQGRHFLTELAPGTLPTFFGPPTCDALTVRIGIVSIDVEAVAHPAVGRQPGAKTDDGKQLKEEHKFHFIKSLN